MLDRLKEDGRPFAEVQPGAVVDLSAHRGKTLRHPAKQALPLCLASFKDFTWPMAPGIKGGRIDLRPIAGTRPRSLNPSADLDLEHELPPAEETAEEQAASLEQTASSMEQLTAAVRSNAENAEQAKRLADEGLVPWPDEQRVAAVLPGYEQALPDAAWFQDRLARHGYDVPRTGALKAAENARASTRRVSDGAMMPSSHSRAVA